jgi:hypothetical protein
MPTSLLGWQDQVCDQQDNQADESSYIEGFRYAVGGIKT